MELEDFVAVAKAVRPRGVRGEIVADLLTDFPERFDRLKNLTAITAGGQKQVLKIESAVMRKGRLYLKFAGIDSAESAEALRDAELCVRENEAIPPGENEYYDWQLADCRVETTEGRFIGTVTQVMRTGAQEILVVTGSGREYLVPFVAAICVNVDITERSIIIDPPEGLLDF
ncbi:MAG: 16S rRNA processing protein RimM [Blastocatellia bacterium]